MSAKSPVEKMFNDIFKDGFPKKSLPNARYLEEDGALLFAYLERGYGNKAFGRHHPGAGYFFKELDPDEPKPRFYQSHVRLDGLIQKDLNIKDSREVWKYFDDDYPISEDDRYRRIEEFYQTSFVRLTEAPLTIRGCLEALRANSLSELWDRNYMADRRLFHLIGEQEPPE